MSSPHFSIIFCGLQTILPGLPRSELSDGIPGMHVLCLTLFNYAISRAACAEWLAMYVWFLYVRKFCGIRSNDMQLLLLRCSFPNNPFTFHLETCLNVIRINANHREWVESFVPSFHCHILCALQTISRRRKNCPRMVPCTGGSRSSIERCPTIRYPLRFAQNGSFFYSPRYVYTYQHSPRTPTHTQSTLRSSIQWLIPLLHVEYQWNCLLVRDYGPYLSKWPDTYHKRTIRASGH